MRLAFWLAFSSFHFMVNLSMTSRERLLAAMQHQPVDHIPCSFMMFKGLWSRSNTYLEFIQKQMELGLDVCVELPPRQPGIVSDSYNLHGLPVKYHDAVTVEEWKESQPDSRWPILIKEYNTPGGCLRVEVNKDSEWPYGDHVPFLDDYVINRSRKFLIEEYSDLEALQYLLVPPGAEEVVDFKQDSQTAIDFAREHDLLLSGGWGVGADLIGWIFGLENMIFAAYDQAGLIKDLLGIIDRWNRSRMKVVLEAGVDLYIKRAWYENCDFWTPDKWREFIFPILKSDVELAHQRGALFGYLITSRCMPLLEMIAEAGVDVVIGVDPRVWDLKRAKEILSGEVCLWGGVNGHLTIEQGTPEAVSEEVHDVLKLFGGSSGFILSPVDNVRILNEVSETNIQILIHEWNKSYSQ